MSHLVTAYDNFIFTYISIPVISLIHFLLYFNHHITHTKYTKIIFKKMSSDPLYGPFLAIVMSEINIHINETVKCDELV